MKKIFVFLFFVLNYQLSTINCLYAKDYYPYFYDAQSIIGGSGKIVNPSTRTVAYHKWGLGIHYFQLSITYGLLPKSEMGIFLDLKELSERKITPETITAEEVSLNFKYQFLEWKEKYHSFACGWQKDCFYLVSDKFFSSFYRWGLLGGISFSQKDKTIKVSPFFTLYQTPRMSMFLLDYNAKDNKYHFGWRFLLSPKIKFDLFLLDLGKIKDMNNFVFGITLSG